MSRRDVDLLAEVTRTLIQASRDGAARGGRELSERLRALARGCQALRFKRLYWILEALAVRLSRPSPDLDGAPLEELGRLLADARYTCKALKSHLTSRLEDFRLVEDLVGTGWPADQVRLMENRTLIRVARSDQLEGNVWYRTSYLLEPSEPRVYQHREHRKLMEGTLESAFLPLTTSNLVALGRVLPTFEPYRLRIESLAPSTLNESALTHFLETAVPDSVGGLLERFRTQREEYLAPRTLPVFFRPRVIDPCSPEALVDRHGNVLPLVREATTFPLVEHLVASLADPPRDTWAVFGKLVFVTGSFLLIPWSVVVARAEEPVLLF